MKKEMRKIGMIFIFGILLISLVSAYSDSNTGLFQFFERDSQSICDEEGRDFLLQIAPFGCTPAVVRSDLLEEQNVPVFCQLAATQVNPLIDVEAISSVSFKGNYSKSIAGIGFYPAKAALSTKQKLNSPALNNVGYLVVTLKKQSNESAMPEFVEGNLSAKIKYDIKNTLGIGRADFYLPVLSETEWDSKYPYYSFWDGKGYIRVNDVTNTEATISIYDNNLKKLTTTKLEKGEESGSMNFPGFDCFANFKLKLNEIANPNKRAKIRLNADVVEVGLNERFLDNKCQVRDLQNNGISQRVTIKCDEDNTGFFGSKAFTLKINPKINISVNDVTREIGVGEYLYSNKEDDKAVYVGYIGTKEDTNDLDDLFVYIVAISKVKGSVANATLSDSQIDSFSLLANRLNLADRKTGVGVIDAYANVWGAVFGGVQTVINLIKGQNSFYLPYKDNGGIVTPKDVFGNTISIVGFAEAADIELDDSEFSLNYENALNDYNEIIESYPKEKYPEDADTELGEEALYKKIEMMNLIGKKKTMLELCDEFQERYPNSNKNLGICKDEYKIANSETSETYVLINGKTKKISFDGIYEPSLEDYNAELIIKGPNGKTKTYTLTSNDLIEIDELRGKDSNESVQLISINDDSIQIKLNIARKGFFGKLKEPFLSDTKTLKLETSENFESDYTFTLNRVHIDKLAKVSLIPNINNAESTAEFSFKVGIEKRLNITLAPDMIKKTINKLNKTIGTFENISNVLGNVTKVMKTACLYTGVALVAKNFLDGLTGESIARQTIMRGDNGWYEICNDLVNKEEYISEEQCLIDKSDLIEEDVSSTNEVMTEINSKIKEIEAKYPGKEQFLGKTIDTDKFMNEYSSDVISKINSLGTDFSDPNGHGEDINIEQMKTILNYDSWKARNYDTEQLKEIELYTEIINSDASEEVKSMAKERLYSDFLDLQLNYKNYVEKVDTANSFGIDPSKFSFLENENTKKVVYEGLTYGDVKGKAGLSSLGIEDTMPVQLVQTAEGSYIVVLDDSAKTGKMQIKKMTLSHDEGGGEAFMIYDLSGSRITDAQIPPVFKRTYFEKYDEDSYKNTYKNYEVRYYETEPYKGLPAVVPFDTKDGWYAATKPTMPVLGQLSPYDASARVTNFYLCNVGKNGLEEFSSLGDDFCQMVNLGTNQPYNKISGLSEAESIKRVEAAVKAIQQASNQYSSGASFININAGYGQIRLKVGSPAVETPEIKCQDFMSPKECQIMFNVCDPVICPSSRCDLGGKYPVKDVVQSGIIGSIALCLPNFVGFGGDVYIPVCLTGVQAGIDGLISVQKSYRDCLQKSLDTGQTVGICDEIHSLYICDFFWRQAAPLANIAIPKIISAIVGQNTRGGGEYLFAQSAWDTAQKSFSSFTSYYQTNSPKAFQIRSVSEFIGDKICQVYTSATYPNGADIISSITTISSPPQFHGRFDEIPFTTVTVPPQSQYKVFYHIFAGKEQGAYYKVYLKADTTSFYQDTATTRVVASGYIGVGEYASETVDFLAPSGYKEMCIDVNGQEECGFKEVSTSFAVDYIEESYVASQAEDSDIKTAGGCVSDANKGIIRICATANPEKGTDAYIGTEKQRWVEAGYCDDEQMICWLDTQSVKDVIDIGTIEENALEEITNSYLANLTGKNYLTESGFESKLTEIERESDNEKKINLINEIIDKIYFTNQKGYAFLLRGNAFAELARMIAESKASSSYSWGCDECSAEGCPDSCPMICPRECPTTSTLSSLQTPASSLSSEEIHLGEQIAEYKCENGKRTDYTCQSVCPGEIVNCVCDNENWKCGQCESECAGTTGKTEDEKAKVEAKDMQETGVYECTSETSTSYTCQFVCLGSVIACECNDGKLTCDSCEEACANAGDKEEDEVLEAVKKDIEIIKKSISITTPATETPETEEETETTSGGEEIIIFDGQTITMPDETSSQFISSTMEFRDGKPTWGNIYYRFFNKQWYWSQDAKDEKNWISVIHLPALGEENREFITNLQGKTYSEGLNLLIDRVVKGASQTIKPTLRSYYADMDYNKQFSFRYKIGVTPKSILLRYNETKNLWKWYTQDNPNGWMVGVQLGGKYYGEPVALIEYLAGKNFYQGAKMMLMLEYGNASAPREIPNVVDKTFIIDRVGFKIDEGETEYEEDVTRTGEVKLVVEYEKNCESLRYEIWKDGIFDIKVAQESTLAWANDFLNEEITAEGKYHVTVLCFNAEGKSTTVTSKNLEVVSSSVPTTETQEEETPAEETESIEEGEIITFDENSEEFSSTTIRYDDGNIFWGDLYYKFFDQKWHWSQKSAPRDSFGNRKWDDITVLPSRGDESKNFIPTLEGKSYSAGLKMFVNRMLSEGSSRSLHTDAADMDFSKRFTYKYKKDVNVMKVYLKYDNNKWQWATSGTPSTWMTGVKSNGNLYSEPVSLINGLGDKDFDTGTVIILSQEYPLWIGQQTAEEFCGYCINAISPDGAYCSEDECRRLNKETSQRFTKNCAFTTYTDRNTATTLGGKCKVER